MGMKYKNIHCEKYRNFAQFSGVEIFGIFVPKNFHTRKLGEITVFCAVIMT